MKLANFLLLIIFLNTNIFSERFESYINNLYPRFELSLEKKFEFTLRNLNSSKKLSTDSKKKISELLFLHMLFTTTGAIDGKKGGILQIPYFWHWTTPNPRHEIQYIPNKKALNKVSPPKGFEKYKSYGDIDRTPSIYLKNLYEEKPLFNNSLYGTFYTFGWCSEREMAFNSVLNILGYNVKIKQEGIHVWSEILLKISDKDFFIIKVDNTFNGFHLEVLKIQKDNWKKDYGNGAQVSWYNKKAHSESEINRVRNI